MPSVAVRLDADMKARLEKLGKARDRSPHYLMKEAIEAYVSKKEDEAAELAEMNRRWEYFELTGDAVPHADIVKWFDSVKQK